MYFNYSGVSQKLTKDLSCQGICRNYAKGISLRRFFV